MGHDGMKSTACSQLLSIIKFQYCIKNVYLPTIQNGKMEQHDDVIPTGTSVSRNTMKSQYLWLILHYCTISLKLSTCSA